MATLRRFCILPEKNDVRMSRFLICCSGDLSDNESEEQPSVAICGGSICRVTGLNVTNNVKAKNMCQQVNNYVLRHCHIVTVKVCVIFSQSCAPRRI